MASNNLLSHVVSAVLESEALADVRVHGSLFQVRINWDVHKNAKAQEC